MVGLLVWLMVAVPAFPRPLMAASVTISPTGVTLTTGSQKQFTARVTGDANTAVTWKVNDIAGGNAGVGTITVAGLYTAPASVPSGGVVTVKAVSSANPAASASATVTVRNQVPLITSVVPSPLPLGPFSLTVNGSKFVSGARVLWNATPLATKFVNAGQLTATGTATQVGTFSIKVVNPGEGAVSAPVHVTVATNVVVKVTPPGVKIQAGAKQQYQATVTGTANQAVTWKVNKIAGGNASVGTINSSGLYTAPKVSPPGGAVSVSATSSANGVTQGAVTAYIKNPVEVTYGRFLDQTSFGPTTESMAHLQQVGMKAFLDEQFIMLESPWPSSPSASTSDAVDAFFANAEKGQDQLRQRVIFGLSEFIVVSRNKNTEGNELIPWLQLLSRNAFGNYRTLLKELTIDASMGKYLDLVNSGVDGGAPNENYPREVMQLFSIGVYKLNTDGSLQLDAAKQPIPAYTETDVKQLARALTGWTYNNASGTAGSGNWDYYPGPMIPVAGKHNTTSKKILGQTLPSGRNARQDLDGAIDIIFNHPNVGPFVATRLIRALVTSNPSPAYIARVTARFNDNGQGVRGDMQAVIRAIIMDPEARNDTPPANFGRLRTPMQHTIALGRALDLDLGPASQFAWLFYDMNEGMLDSPSVFGHYSPYYRVPKTPLFGPEFQIYSASEAVNRGNFFYWLMADPWPINPALQPYVNAASNSTTLLNAVDKKLLFGRMSPQLRAAITKALPTQYDNNARALTALYLTVMSGEYLVQY